MKKHIRIAILLTLALVVLSTTAILGACSSKTPDYAPSTPRQRQRTSVYTQRLLEFGRQTKRFSRRT